MLKIPFTGGSITGAIVDILVPRGKEYKGTNNNDKLPTRLNFKVDTVCLQVGNHNKVTIVVADRTEAEAVSDCFTTERESNRLAFRVLRRNGSTEELVLADEENAKNEIINIQADFVRIIPSTSVHESVSHEFRLDSKVNAPVYVQIGHGNKLVIGPSDPLNAFDNSRPVLRALRMLPKEPILPASGKSDFPNFKKDHLVVLDVAGGSAAKEWKEKRGDLYEVQVKVSRCENNGGKMKDDGFLCQKDSSLSSFREITGFWFRFQQPNANYIVKFSLWKNHKTLQTKSELLDEIHTSVQTSESTRRTHHDKENDRSFETKPQTVSLPAEVNTSSLVLNDFFECCNCFMDVLLPLRDNGDWEKFDNEAKRLLDECKDVTVQIAIVLEQGMAARHRNELEVAEMFIREASAMFPRASSHVQSLLKGRASCYLAGIYRRDKLKLGRAQKCVESARNYLRHPTSFTLDQGFLAYEEGCLLLEYAGRKTSLLEQAKRSFERAYELCSKGAQSNPFVRKHHLTMVVEKYQRCCTALGMTGEVFAEGSVPVSSVIRGI